MELKLAQWLAGEFSNESQALSQPAWFVNLKLWHRPLPFLIDGNYALFAEQAPTLKLEQAYRQRILVIQPATATEPMKVQYYAFNEHQKWRGAGRNPQILDTLTLEEIKKLPGCVLNVTSREDQFFAQPSANSVCQFYIGGNLCQIELGFAVTTEEFRSYDKGIDPETQKPIWGALIAPYQFQKIKQF
ncbi:MAG: chromophore lyase CpcT/CpeT [Halothece sp. Uz-M2-17]|nr:chromophore lyase CpcT/CpeT [Halothece sp. Uz-M2-17]